MMNSYMQALQDERSRILNNVVFEKESACLGQVSYLLQCPEGATQVLENAIEILLAVDSTLLEVTAWPSLEEWRVRLPRWFVDKCRKERTLDEAQKYLEWWDHLTYEEKIEQSKRSEPWSIENWVSYFEPEQREWYWWSAKVIDTEKLLVKIEVKGHPFPSGSLFWLLEASGAERIEEVEDE